MSIVETSEAEVVDLDDGSGTVVLLVDGALAQLELNRPRRLNALAAQTLDALVAAAQALERRPTVKVVILSGAGKDFCAGADVRLPFTDTRAELLTSVRHTARLGGGAIQAIRTLRPVTIALVQGRAIGAGFLLAAACDLRVGTDDATFSLPEVDLGIPVGWGGVPLIIQELGPALARELILTGRVWRADEAVRAGFLTRAVTRERANSVVHALAESVAHKPAGALRRSKRQIQDALLTSIDAPAEAELLAAALDERLDENPALPAGAHT